MKIKDYKCKCGENDFFFDDKGNQKGIYCSYCGRWLKWASKDEQNLDIKQETILDKIRADIENEVKFWSDPSKCNVESAVNSRKAKAQSYKHCLEIIDKYKAESEYKE